MGLERSSTLYLANGTTVDTGTGIDVRLLSATNGGANDVTQTCTATHTQDNVERTFDPATAGVTTAADATTLQKLGWALRLSNDMTPTDDTNCDATLLAGTATVSIDVAITLSGGTTLSSNTPTWKASLWRYNPSTDTGTLIGSGSNGTTAWNPATESGTFKTISISISVGSTVTFAAGEVLMLQVGLNTGTLGNPLAGTITYTFTLRIDNSTTKIAWAAGQSIAQLCTFAYGGSITPAASVKKTPNKFFAGGGTPTGVVAKTASKFFTGSIASAGVIVRITKKVLTGSIATAGTLVKQTNKFFTGSIASSGGLTRVPFLAKSGTITSAGSIARKVPILLRGGGLTPSGALKKTSFKFFSGFIASAGALTKTRVKYLVGSITSNSTLFRAIAKFFGGSISSSGAIKKTPNKNLNANVTPTGAPPKFTVVKNLAGFLYGPAGSGGATVIKKIINTIFDD